MGLGIRKEEWLTPSSREGHRLHVISWEPADGEIKGIVQIVHGMCEYVERYHLFAMSLAADGYAVIGHDHLGHGKTAPNEEELGYFAEKDGDKIVIGDMYRVTSAAKKRWPEKPVCIMGHSMGSYFTRKYLTKYSRKVDAAIIMGTGDVPAAAGIGILLAGLICKRKGDHYRSKLLTSMALGSNNKRIVSPKTENDWLSINEENVERYNADRLCGFPFTAGAYRDFFRVLVSLKKAETKELIRKDIPVLFISGEEDPVGQYGKGVRRVYEGYRKTGIDKADLILYPMLRHEILNETEKEDIFQNIRDWLNSVLF